MRDKISRIWSAVLPSLLVLVFFGIYFAGAGLYPFGEDTISWCDMNQQVVPLLLDFKDILAGKSGFFLSFANGGGMNFWGVFFFFLASPFSFLVIFVEKTDLLGFMNVLTVLKLAACAFTANLYFRKACRNEGLSRWTAGLLSLLYVFGAYGFLYYQNSIWLDEMYLFPLLLLSLEALLEKKKVGPYIATMTAVVVVNYYISYMVIAFVLLYMGLHFWLSRAKKRDPNKTEPEPEKTVPDPAARLFIVGSLIAALLSAVVWVPSFYQYLTSGRQSNILDGLASCNFLSRWNTTLLVLLASGSTVSVLLVSRVLGEKRRAAYRKERILFLLLCVPIFLEPVNRMWHTGSYMSFPTRYGFMTLFMGLVCVVRILPGAQDAARTAARRTMTLLGVLLTGAYAAFLLWYWQTKGEGLTAYTSTLWGSDESVAGLLLVFAAAFLAYGGLYLLYRCGVKRSIVLGLSLILILAEAGFNTKVYMLSAQHSTQAYQAAVDLENRAGESDAGFWRIKTNRYLMEENMEGAIGYRALSHYTSLTSQEYLFLMKHWGYSSYWMKVSSYGGTKFSDALLSVRYTIDKRSSADQPVYANDRFALTETEYYLPLGLLYTGDLSGLDEVTERIPFQETVFEALWPEAGTLFEGYEPSAVKGCTYTQTDGTYSIRVDDEAKESYLEWTVFVGEAETLYLDLFDSYSNRLKEAINGSFAVSVNGYSVMSEYPQQSYNGLLTLGTFENETVTVRLDVQKDVRCASFGLYGMKEAVLAKAVASAKTADWQEVANGADGRVTVDEETECLLMIPYDTGFTLRINGQVTDYTRVLGGFICFTLPAGTDTITLRYVSPGFTVGLMMTMVGVVLLLGAWLYAKKKTAQAEGTNLRSGGRVDRLAVWLCRMAGILVFIGLYLFPLLWNGLH
jgi:uncharacterized membrane protein YfhO